MPSVQALPDLPEAVDRTSHDDILAEEHFRYLRDHRRVTIGPAVSLVFENGKTLWFRLQELAQVARRTGSSPLQAELEWYSRLLPTEGLLRAAVWIGLPGRRTSKDLEPLRRAVATGRIAFQDAKGTTVLGRIRTDRVADPSIGLSLWVEFPFSVSDLAAFEESNRGWHLTLDAGNYRHTGEVLSDSVWLSLLKDLN